jgi:polysaccharide pyruvyl transferase CsaB
MQAVICGYYGKDNGGDEALLMSLLQMLPREVTPLVLSNNPAQTHARYGVKSYPSRSALAILQALNESQAFIWGGGSLMQDVSSWISPLYYAGLMALAQQKGLKTIAWAQGIGPLKRPFTRWLTKQVLLGCTAVSVRDGASAQLLAQWGIKALIAPDPVWALAGAPVSSIANLPTPRVAVNLRSHRCLTGDRLEKLTQALIDLQKTTQASLILLPFQPSQDLEIAHTIGKRLPGVYEVITLEDPRQLKGIFRSVEMLLGMRLHSLIMAAAEQCRCFALSYDPKVTRLMQETQLLGWEMENLPEDPQTMSRAWIEHLVNGESLNKDQIQSLVDRAFMHRDLLETYLR